MEKRENLIDILKLCFAFCILLLHTGYADGWPVLLEWYTTRMVLRLGVPFFFVASGYFFSKRFLGAAQHRASRTEAVKHYVIPKLLPFAVWSAVSLLFYALELLGEGTALPRMLAMLVRQQLFYPRGAMWFLLACIVAVIIIHLLWPRKKLLIALAVLGYGFALLCNTYYYIVENTAMARLIDAYLHIFISARNGLGVGLLYIGLGIWLGSGQCPVTRWSTSKLALATAAFYLLLFVEVTLCINKHTSEDNSLFLALPGLVCCLLLLAQRITVPISHAASIRCRRLSVYLFYLHFPIHTLYTLLCQRVTLPIWEPAVVTACCLAIWFMTKDTKNKLVRSILA